MSIKRLPAVVVALAAFYAVSVRPVSAEKAAAAAPAAAAELSSLYRSAKSASARFWVVDAMERRLRDRNDPAAARALLDAAKDKDPDVRRKALRALTAAKGLPSAELAALKSQLAAAAEAAAKDKRPALREAGLALAQALGAAAPAAAAGATPAPSPTSPVPAPRGRIGLGVLWVIAMQAAAFCWFRLGAGLMRDAGESGRGAARWLSLVFSRGDALALALTGSGLFVGWAGALVGSVLARLVTPGAESFAPPSGWLSFGIRLYLGCAVAALAPAGLLAASATRHPIESPGLFRAAREALSGAPRQVLASFLFALVWPFEWFWRASSRGPAFARWAADLGTPLASALAAATAARDGVGHLEGSRRARRETASAAAGAEAAWLARPQGAPAFVALAAAAPLLFSLTLAPARFFGFDPTELLDLWFLSATSFMAAFGLWAGALVTGASLVFVCCAAGLYAGARVRPND